MRHRRLRKGGSVKRFHVVPTIGDQTVASHSWGVAAIILDLWPDASAELLKAALWHDVAEHVTGDVPWPMKEANPAMKQILDEAEDDLNADMGLTTALTETEKRKLKAADMLELLWYCLEQRELGNTNLNKTFSRGRQFINTLTDLPEAQDMADKIGYVYDGCK